MDEVLVNNALCNYQIGYKDRLSLGRTHNKYNIRSFPSELWMVDETIGADNIA